VVSSETAEDALTSVFVVRPDLYKAIAFDGESPSLLPANHIAEYWENMTVERAFLARVYVDHCIKNKDEAIMEDVLPTVSDLAFRIQEEYNKLEETFVTEDEDDLAERSFIVGELMRLAVNMDYTDQFGRTTMFQHARKFPVAFQRSLLTHVGEMISQPNLPSRLVDKCMDILCKIANSERDLIRIVVDVVSELREGQGEEEIDAVSQQRLVTSQY
jgi:condensin complex subunit 3